MGQSSLCHHYDGQERVVVRNRFCDGRTYAGSLSGFAQES